MSLTPLKIESEPINLRDVSLSPGHLMNESLAQKSESLKDSTMSIDELDSLLDKTEKELLKNPSVLSVERNLELAELQDEYPSGEPVPVKLNLRANIVPRFSLSVGSGINSDNEVTASINAEMNNALKAGEKISASYDKNMSGLSEFDLSCGLYNPYILPSYVKGSFFRKSRDMTNFASVIESATGLSLSANSKDGSKKIAYTYAARRNIPFALSSKPQGYEGPCAGIIEESIKKSAKSSISFDHLLFNSTDSYASPNTGQFLHYLFEFAGLAGTVKHFKLTARAGWYRPVPNFEDFSVGYTTTLGALYSFESLKKIAKPADSLINDRFFLGGISTVPGFAVNSIGPKQLYDSIGGDIVFNKTLSLKFPLPVEAMRLNGLKGFCFTSTGNVFGIPQKNLLQMPTFSGVANFAKAFKYSVGIGIEWPLEQMSGSLRLCFVKTFNASKRDCTCRVQFGVCAGVA